jgi:hypothetical protein
MQETVIICILIAGAAFIISKAVNRLRRDILVKHSESLDKFDDLERVLLDIRDGTKNFFRERRSFPRVSEQIAAKLKGGSADEFLAVANISRAGALLKAKREFKKDDILELEIFSSLYSQPMAVKSKVVNVTAVKASAKEKAGFEIGVKFIEISPSNRDRLAEMIGIIGRNSV